MKHFVVAAVVLWLLAIAGISTANAAQLSVTSSTQATLVTLSKCADASLASTAAGTPTSGNYTQVAVSNIPAACQGLPMNVFVHGAGGAVVASGLATPTAASANVTTGSYAAANVTAVVVRINGWVFPTNWTSPPPPPPVGPFFCEELTPYPGNDWESPARYGTPTGNLCTVTVVSSSFWGNNQHFNMTFTVSGAANWRVTVDFTDPFFNGLIPTRLTGNGNPLLATGYNCNQLPTFVGQTNLGWEQSARPTGYLSGSSSGGGGNLC